MRRLFAHHHTHGTATPPPPPVTHTLTVTLAGTGTGRVTGPGIDTDASDFTQVYTEGTVIDLNGSSGDGSTLVWSGDGTGSSTSSDRTFTMNGDRATTATFTAPSAGAPTVNGTGTVRQEDLNVDTTPLPLWKQVADGWYDGTTWTSADQQVQRLSASPDTHIPVGQTSAPTHYWRLATVETPTSGAQTSGASTVTVVSTAQFPAPAVKSTCSINGTIGFTYTGKTATTLTGCANWTSSGASIASGAKVRLQSITDAAVPNSSYRAQLVNNSSTNTFYAYPVGSESITYMSVRCQSPTPIPAGVRTQLWQIKETSAGGLSPILASSETSTGFDIVQNYNRNIVTLATITAPKGVWLRLAIAVKFSNDPAVGYFQLWGDLTGSGNFTQLTSKILCRTAYDGVLAGSTSTLSIGPYYKMVNPAVYRDYAGIQVCDFTHP
jgi:hypothetical protein